MILVCRDKRTVVNLSTYGTVLKKKINQTHI